MAIDPDVRESLTLRLISRSPSQTQRFGKTLGRLARARDVFCLTSPLGGGKTTFVRGLALGLTPSGEGIEREPESHSVVVSPSFTLIHEHAGRLPYYHIDLYRLSPEAVGQLGLEEYLEREAVVIIEWAERLPPGLAEDRLEIELGFGQGDRERELVLRAIGARPRELLASAKGALKSALARD